MSVSDRGEDRESGTKYVIICVIGISFCMITSLESVLEISFPTV